MLYLCVQTHALACGCWTTGLLRGSSLESNVFPYVATGGGIGYYCAN